MNQEQLFNLQLRDLRLKRAHNVSRDLNQQANYLYDHSADALIDRVCDVTRGFNNILEIGYRDDNLKNKLIKILTSKNKAQDVDPTIDSIINYDALSFIPGDNKDIKTIGHDEVLPVTANSYDLIISNLSLHHCNDIIGMIIQAKLALKPDGLLLVSLFGAETLKELRHIMRDVEAAMIGGISPRFSPLVDIRDGGGLLQRANLALPVADKEIVTVHYRDCLRLMHDLRAMGQTNILTTQNKKILPRQFFPQLCAAYNRHYGDTNNHIPASFDLVYLTGWAPSDNQQKPLKPGSAKNKLSQALGTIEEKLER